MTLHLPTGFASLDTLLGGGLRREDLIVLGGESGVGCSALALGLAVPAAGSRPTLAMLGDAGVREQADLILALHREDLHRPDPAVAGAAELLLLKDRCGTTGSVDLWFEPRWSRFEDLAEA